MTLSMAITLIVSHTHKTATAIQFFCPNRSELHLRSRAAARPTEKETLISRDKFNYSQRVPVQKC